MKLKKNVVFSGKIHCLSGLHIGGTSNSLEIGGVDNEVIKNPVTGEPYIPGSSLKGKMRSEAEKRYGTWEIKDGKLIDTEGTPCKCGRKECMVCLLYGAHREAAESDPTRIIVRDAVLSKEFKETIPYMLEHKTENMVNRKSGKAESPRTTERVPEGVSFDFEIILRIYEDDKMVDMINEVEKALTYVEESYLGGSGSRGYGNVKFEYTIQD